MTDHVLPGQPSPIGGDPTAVMGRRIVAWLIDLLMFLGVMVVTFIVLAAPVDVPETVVLDACEVLQAREPDEAAGCFEWDDGTVYVTSAGDNAIQFFVSLFYFADFVVLQGLVGGSPGKLLMGLRVVNEDGRRAGIGRSLTRTLLWIVDGAPWLLPLVGFITGLTSTGHRRVGDLAAKTYVVHRSSMGQPPFPGLAGTGSGAPAGWAPPPPAVPAGGSYAPSSWPAEPPTPVDHVLDPDVDPAEVEAIVDQVAPSDGPATGPDASEPDPSWWEVPDVAEVPDPSEAWQPPTTPGDDFAVADDDDSPTAGPTPFVAPGMESPPPLPPVTIPSPAAAPVALPPPQWDQARGTYIQWDPRRQQWLQWDAAGNRWVDISR